MSEPNAPTDDLMLAALRCDLGRTASRARNSPVETANAPSARDVKSTGRVIVTRLREAHGGLLPYQRTTWLRARRGVFAFCDPRLGR
jgi:hypothetical protein